MSKVSIILPVYNAKEYQLSRSIGSVVSQTYTDIELIIINDSSSLLETLDYLEKTDVSDDRIKVYNNEKNTGISCSRNRGIELATGEYICFLDQDDYYQADYIEKLLQAVTGNNTEIAMCGYEIRDAQGNITKSFPSVNMDLESPWYPWATCAIWNRIYKKQFLENNDIKFPKGCLIEDLVFVMQCNMANKETVVINDRLYVKSDEATSTSRSRQFYSLRLDQMPIQQIEGVVKRYAPCNRFLHAYVCNEIALLIGVLCIGDDGDTVRRAIKASGCAVRNACKGNTLRDIIEYNDFCDDKREMRILNILVHVCYKLHIETPVLLGFHYLSKMIYKQFQ